MLHFIKSFGWAFNGLIIFFRHERNGQVQLAAGTTAVILAFIFEISAVEWAFIIGCITAVLSMEMMNSSLEKLCNLVHPKYHPAVKTIKDMAAGAVLWLSLGSAIIGSIIFVPHVIELFD